VTKTESTPAPEEGGGPLRQQLGHMATDPPEDLKPLSLAQAALVGVLDARDLGAHVLRLKQLAGDALPPRPDNRLRHVAGLRAAADLIGDLPLPVLPMSELADAVEQARGAGYLWESLADLALAYAIRVHGAVAAAPLWPLRAAAPLGEDVVLSTTLAAGLEGDAVDPSWVERESGWLAASAAIEMVGTARVATTLALTARFAPASRSTAASRLDELAHEWAAANEGLVVSEPRWSVSAQGRLVLGVAVRGAAEQVAVALPSVSVDLVHRLGWHLERIRAGALKVTEVEGAKRRADLVRASAAGVELILRTDGYEPAERDLIALRSRQEAALRWLRHRHEVALPELRVEAGER
jgi:hypothetical protein